MDLSNTKINDDCRQGRKSTLTISQVWWQSPQGQGRGRSGRPGQPSRPRLQWHACPTPPPWPAHLHCRLLAGSTCSHWWDSSLRSAMYSAAVPDATTWPLLMLANRVQSAPSAKIQCVFPCQVVRAQRRQHALLPVYLRRLAAGPELQLWSHLSRDGLRAARALPPRWRLQPWLPRVQAGHRTTPAPLLRLPPWQQLPPTTRARPGQQRPPEAPAMHGRQQTWQRQWGSFAWAPGPPPAPRPREGA